MKSESVPMIVVHFRGFEISGLATLNEKLMKLVLELAQKAVVLVAVYGGCVGVTLIIKTILTAAFNAVAYATISFATYSSCVMLSTKLIAMTETAPALLSCGKCCSSTLPCLNLQAILPRGGDADTASNEGLKKEDENDNRYAAGSRFPQLPAVRQRIMAGLRRGPVNVNRVQGERRKRADMSLFNAKIRVGKALVETSQNRKTPVDLYMVRIECATEKQEKHMNPVVMWDLSATYAEFKRLETELRKELRHKRLRNLQVPHLSAGTILFAQPELTTHVLNARRVRLQAFLDAIRLDKVLADLDATRKFCQAF